MKILIIEDETPALNRLKKLIDQLPFEVHILGTADSIETAEILINQYPQADLLLMDIELADGQSFELFNRISIDIPVIFTTAYDAFALRAFKVNSIDYLLKPIHFLELEAAFTKFRNRSQQAIQSPTISLEQLLAAIQPQEKQVRNRFLVKSGTKLIPIEVHEIAYFQSREKYTWLIHQKGGKYIVDHTLDELQTMLNPKQFFALNRQYIISYASIRQIHSWHNGKLKVELIPEPNDEEILVSREKSPAFKEWLGS